MMMGLGSLGYGGPSSSSSSPSSSNLSALAPPFTVDRFNSKPSSNSLVQFPELPYAAPFGHTWQPFTNPLAPRPDTMYQKPELEIDSTRITSVPLPDDYSFQYSVSQPNDLSQAFTWSTVSPNPKNSSSTLLYDCKMDSFYKPYVPSMVDHDSPLVALSEPSYDLLPSSGLVSADVSSQADYTHNLHGLEYGTPLRGVWNGTFDGGKLGKQAELNGASFLDNTTAVGSSTYQKQIVQGNSSCGQFSGITARQSGNGLVRMECKDNMSHSFQSVLSIPLDSARTTISSSSFTIPASHPPGSALHSSTSLSGSVSVTKSSPALVIRPPHSGIAIVPQKSSSGKTLIAANFGAFHPSEGLGKNNPLKGKEPQILFDSESEEGSLFTSQVKRQKEGNKQLFSAPSVMGEVSSKSKCMNGSKVKFESPVRSIDATDGSSMSIDNFQTVKSFDIGSDCMDHHNFAVDSPCWKGAPASHFSPFDVVEAEITHQFGSKTDMYCQLGLQADQTLLPTIDPIRCLSVKAGEDKVRECGHAERGLSAIPGNILEADCIAREQRSVDAVKAIFKGPNLMNSKGVQFSEEVDAPREEYNLPKHSKNEHETKSSSVKKLGVEEDNIITSDLSFRAAVIDSVLSIGDTTEGDVAVRAAETVLCSPSSEEGASELAKPYGGQLPPKMDVQALIKALHGLSDLLLFSCSADSCTLKDQEIEVIKHVMRNLERLTSKKMEYFTESKDAQLHQQDTCDKVGDSPDPCMSYHASKYQFENGGRKSRDCLSRDDKMRNDHVSHEKAGIFHPFNPPRGDLDVLGDDNMAQAIRKVLEENFPYREEMESQALLFKNLWLEAEAKLCSISYRIRFDRMKMEMQKFKSNQAKESEDASEKTSGCNSLGDLNMLDVPSSAKFGNDSNLKSIIWSLRRTSSTSKANDVEASIMSRFDTLKRHDESRSANLVGEEADIVDGVSSGRTLSLQDQAKDRRQNLAVEPECDSNQGHLSLHVDGSGHEPVKDGLSSTSNADDVEASVMNRFRILKCRDDSKTKNVVVEQASKVDTVSSDMMPFLKGQAEDLRLNLAVEPHSQTTDVSQKLFGLYTDGPRYELVKDFFPSMPADGVNQSSATNAPRNQYSLGSSDNCSSDWEHVLKDDVSWR